MRDDKHSHGHRHFAQGGPWWAHHHGHHGRGRGPGRGPGRRGQDWFGGEGGWPWGGQGPFGGPGGFGGGRERLERGLLRHIILSVLKDGPKHGYEIIKHLEEHTFGRYSPSPGTLYPTLQYLEDLGLLRSEQDGEKRVYSLTESGQEELDKQHQSVEGFWSRFSDRMPSGAHMHEVRFAGDALKDLLRTFGDGLRIVASANDSDAARKIRLALEKAQNEIREIIAGSTSSPDSASNGDTGGES